MKLKSLIQNVQQLEVADVEIEFIPGIPQIHFLGLPDRLIKESFYRIKSALKNSGYQFPITSQVIVNIKPSHLRKSSRGVELAVAIGILLKTKQISEDTLNPEWIIYGELGLDGNVYQPSDLADQIFSFKENIFVTGQQMTNEKKFFPHFYRLTNVKNFELERNSKETQEEIFKRPEQGLQKFYSEKEAEFIFLAIASGLHGLLAGDSGAGKSTLARSLLSFMKTPTYEQAGRWQHSWRPLVTPHQSITPAAFLGGGQNIYEGEVERASGGILLLDEFLEFDPEILESLRAPMTGEPLRIARGPSFREVKSNFQVIATTNLCPCGKWTPLKINLNCRFSRTKCTRYLERFSGPILDRFGLLYFTESAQTRKISGYEILKRIERFQQKEKMKNTNENQLIERYYTKLPTRRRNYLKILAEVYAQERAAEALNNKDLSIGFEDFNRAEEWALKPFELLEKGMS